MLKISEKFISKLLIVCIIVWVAAHISGIFYGTKDLPLHMSYVGDEQAPVNGALHILQDKSLVALKNLTTVYYGPLFSVIALPAVAGDFVVKYITGVVNSAEEYKNFILWNWGGIVVNTRLLAVVFGLFGLVMLYRLLSTKTINPGGNRILSIIGVSILATNFYYFEYSHFFRHWIFILSLLIAQIYCAIKIAEEDRTRRYWIYSAVLFLLGFGISYLSLLFQVLWLPLLVKWIMERKFRYIKELSIYTLMVVLGVFLIILWHPYGFFRILGLTTGNAEVTNTLSVLKSGFESSNSFSYYVSIIYNNHLPLLIAWLFLAGSLSATSTVFRKYWFWVPLMPGMVGFVVFGLFSHHEARYVLPTLIMFIVHSAMLLVFYFSTERGGRLINKIIITLITLLLIFHIAHILQWMRIMSGGPQEQQIISRVTSLQEEDKSVKTLFLQYYILGHVHTKEAYQDYMIKFDKAKYNLYQEITKTPLPVGVEPINVYYYRPDELPFHGIIPKDYKYVFYRYEPYYSSVPFDPEFDFIESNLVQLWFYKDFRDKYFCMSHKNTICNYES